MSRVLVTGGTGFLGAHVLVALLKAGHMPRTTVRDLGRGDEVSDMVATGGADPRSIDIVRADLTEDSGWAEAVAGCDFVLHVASPFPGGSPKDENDLIRPARDGALRVLRAARDACVRRVVMTSSFAAIGYGHAPRRTAFNETDWSNPDAPDVQPYIKSKIVAERAAWDFVAQEGQGLELSVINPTGIFGPILDPDFSISIRIVEAMLEGKMLFAPRLCFGVVDVRDVADLHLLAMASAAAAGERFIAVSGEPLWMIDVARILRAGLSTDATKVPRFQAPDWLVRVLAPVSSGMRDLVPQLGVQRRASNVKAKERLGWAPRAAERALIDTARSLLDLKAGRL